MPLPLLWAAFANPALLYALAAAGVPILIHLLNRRKYREVPWAAMRFLLAALRKNRRRLRLEHWLLLAIRTLVVLLVVTAMARPYLESFGAIIAGSRTHRVIVLDNSLSMGYTAGESSRFDQAKAVAAQLVKDSRRGDAISVILMGAPPRVVIGDPTQNLSVVKKEIEELTLSDGGTDLAMTFEKVNSLLELKPNDQKEVVYLTDLQTASWRPPAESGEAIKAALTRLETYRPRSVVIDLGKSEGTNRAVTDLRLDVPVVTVGTPVLIRYTLHNFGANRVDGVRVRLTSDGRLSPDQSLDLPAALDVPAVFRQQFDTEGDHVVEVSIDDDPLAIDNHRWLVVPVRESLKVLLVDGHLQSGPYQAETDYLAQALSPGEDSPGQPRPIRVEVIADSQLRHSELAKYDVVVLCNVGQFSEPEVTSLEEFLQQGGGVVVFGGDQVVADNYNRLLYVDGKGLLPASIGPSVGDAAKKEAGFFLNPLGYRHPIVAAYQGETEPVTAGLTQAITFQYHKLVLPRNSAAETALRFDTGDPAVIQSKHHQGTVILVATSADTGWTTWPVHKSYPPVMQEIVLQAAAGKMADRNIRVGQPFDQSFPSAGASAPVTVVPPRGAPVEVKLQPAGGISQLHFDRTDVAGPYQIRIGPPVPRESSFTANTDPAESDPAKLDRAGLAELLPGWNFLYLTNSRALSADASSVRNRGEVHRSLLYGLLILLLVESLLAWKFGHHDPAS